jgi:putative restriction endonuclease
VAILRDFLDITPTAASEQWRQVARRQLPGTGQRQEPFLPIEVILCQALFFLLDPHRFGGRNIHLAPPEMLQVAVALRRRPSSLNYKMLNLDGSQPHGGRLEPEVFARFAASPALLARAHSVVMDAARREGFGPEIVPDVLAASDGDEAELLGQDELGAVEVNRALSEDAANIGALEREGGLPEGDAQRVVEQRVRLGQHRFARDVLRRFEHRCGFCGFAPRALGRHGLLIASHVKPWRDCTSARERLDPRNGIAACPVHDAAFDAGLLTVNGGLRIHLSPLLESHVLSDRVAESYFGHPPLGERLQLPAGSPGPDPRYLAWHRAKLFKGGPAAG